MKALKKTLKITRNVLIVLLALILLEKAGVIYFADTVEYYANQRTIIFLKEPTDQIF